ncbi:MAG: metallophosphoesterase [Carboxylicivirga sp.]|jgi:predicted MPP superfamily phosphohydrolase|nr:metallophosphoesterase [Carboxylicivirga sp.]
MQKAIITVLLAILVSIGAIAQSGHPKLENDQSWSMIVIPDPQSYSKYELNQPVFELMTRWIKKNKEKLNIELVLCEGDLVEQNNIFEADGRGGDQNSEEQWSAVREAFATLDDVVPCIVCTGNHDYGRVAAENRYSQLNAYFTPANMPKTKRILKGMLPNYAGEKTLENAWYEYVSPHGVNFLIVSLEFNPRAKVVKQMKEVVAREEYKDHKVMILTHSYMRAMTDNNALIVKEGYKVKDVTHGKALWKKLIAPSENIEMVLCGHIAGTNNVKQNIGYRKEKNAAGNEVHQMLFNAQTDGGGWQGNGGDGWLRILEFLPDGKTVVIKTFSPYFAFSPSTIDKAWRNESFDSFTIELAE